MAELRALLKAAGAYREGHFVLEGFGHVLSYYDCVRLFQYPHLTSQTAEMLLQHLNQLEANFIFTPSVTSLTLAFELARHSHRQFVMHDKPFEDPRYKFPVNTTVMIIEDVVVSGTSLTYAQEWCEKRGAQVAGFGVLIDRRRSAETTFNGLPLVAGIKDPVEVYEAQDCPACQAGIPFEVIPPNYIKRIS